MTVAAVLLAAGAGSRFHGDTHKLLAPFGDSTVFESALAPVLDAGFDEVIVVVGAADLAEYMPAGVTVVENPSWNDGQATSLAAAVDHLNSTEHSAAVFGLADQPGATPECWSRLRTHSADLAVATYDGEPRNPVRLARPVWADLPRQGDYGARHVLRARASEVDRVACSGRSDDIDTVEDLRSWS